MWIRCQAGADRVVLHIVSDAVQFRFVAHAMVEGFILPEGLPRSAQDQVGTAVEHNELAGESACPTYSATDRSQPSPGMEPAKCQVTNTKIASARSGCQW